MERTIHILTVSAWLAGCMPALAGQVPVAASDPDIPISHRDRVYSAEQFSNTVSVTDPFDNKLLGIIRLGDPLPFADGAYDAVVACGVLTTGHAPASCLDELVRITRRGGYLVFTLRSDRTPPGYDGKMAELGASGRWELVERGEEFQAMPTSEPEVLVRVWAFRSG